MTSSAGSGPASPLLVDAPLVMGIVNVTPDSFYDGGRHNASTEAIRHAIELHDEGADIVDIGGESTRPPGNDYGAGATQLSESEELARVMPVIEGLLDARAGAVISIDTMKPEVARQALRAGARIINDVSAGGYDPEIWRVAAEADADYILMHGHNPSEVRSVDTIVYGDVVNSVHEFLQQKINEVRRAGVERIIADPGIGFAKGAADNIRLINRLGDFADLGVRLLVGASRKSFIGRILDGIPPEDRLAGSLAAHAAAWLHGAAIVRTHDALATKQFFKVLAELAP